MTSLAPVPSPSTTCPHCSAPLVADQRYCLSCGQPASPVRLAFLDVLSTEHQSQIAPAQMAAPGAYPPYGEPAAGPAWVRRFAPLFGVMAVLLLAMLIGLLMGHWVSQSKAPGQQVIKIEGLSAGTPLASAAATTPAAAATGTTSASAGKEEKQEEAEAKAEEKHPAAPPAPVKVSSSTLNKLSSTTGKKHQEELNKIGTAPIQVP